MYSYKYKHSQELNYIKSQQSQKICKLFLGKYLLINLIQTVIFPISFIDLFNFYHFIHVGSLYNLYLFLFENCTGKFP